MTGLGQTITAALTLVAVGVVTCMISPDIIKTPASNEFLKALHKG